MSSEKNSKENARFVSEKRRKTTADFLPIFFLGPSDFRDFLSVGHLPSTKTITISNNGYLSVRRGGLGVGSGGVAVCSMPFNRRVASSNLPQGSSHCVASSDLGQVAHP